MKFTNARDLASTTAEVAYQSLTFLINSRSVGSMPRLSQYEIDFIHSVCLKHARCHAESSVSVISLSVGTGKTPAVITIAKYLQKEGKRVAILLRGYKRRVREEITIVSDGKKVCASPTESGDEAHMMARHLSDIPIIAGKSRYLTGRVALERFNVDVLLLDDGFQHRQLARDVDILTLPRNTPFRKSRGVTAHRNLARTNFCSPTRRPHPANTYRQA